MSPSFTEDDISTTLAGSSAGSGAGSPRQATSGRSLFSRKLALQSETTTVQGSPTQADDDVPPTTDSGRVHLNSTLVGWPYLAQKMADTPEFECFRRFRELNVKTLLYYQVELAMLEAELREKEAVDIRSNGKQHSFSERADRMFRIYQNNNKSGPGARPETEQCKLVLEIRQLLGQYNAALLQHAEVSSLPQPNALNVQALRSEIDGPYTSLVIRGMGSDAWDISTPDPLKKTHLVRRILSLLKSLVIPDETSSKTATELVTVPPPPELDMLTRWVAQDLTPFWHKLRSKDSDPNNQTKHSKYSVSRMQRYASAMTTITACLLPIAGIWTLTTAETTTQKIGYIAGFTTLFAIVVTWITDAKSRLHIFTATSAFSAVLVVFVQNQ